MRLCQPCAPQESPHGLAQYISGEGRDNEVVQQGRGWQADGQEAGRMEINSCDE